MGLHDRLEKFLGEVHDAAHTRMDSSFGLTVVLDNSILVLAAARIFDVAKELD